MCLKNLENELLYYCTSFFVSILWVTWFRSTMIQALAFESGLQWRQCDQSGPKIKHWSIIVFLFPWQESLCFCFQKIHHWWIILIISFIGNRIFLETFGIVGWSMKVMKMFLALAARMIFRGMDAPWRNGQRHRQIDGWTHRIPPWGSPYGSESNIDHWFY